MDKFAVLLSKEINENIRTKKFLVMMCVFVTFAILSPLMARYMGEFFEFLLPAGEAEVFMALFPAPTWIDSYVQFYGNMVQTGAIVIILVFMSLVLREKRTGTADLLFCKGASRFAFVLAKFTVAAAVTLVCLLAAILINYGYTVLLFDEGGQIGYVLLGAGAYGVFLLMLIAWTLLASTLAKSTAISAVFGFLGFIVILMVGGIPRIGRFLPGGLIGNNIVLTQGNVELYKDFYAHVGVALGLTVLFIWLAVVILKRQEW
jgi:ABC-2 type transport system permease protein